MRKKDKFKVAALFAGAGGLDRGFKNSGFEIPWANEFDKSIWETYERNFPDTNLDRRSITEVGIEEIPDVDGFIGGPPCQSWSEAGASRGIEDKRGQLFFEYIRLIEAKQPKFFLAENVSGILFSRHTDALSRILNSFAEIGYNVSYGLLNANDFGVPEDRERVIIVGYRTDIRTFFSPPQKDENRPTLADAIYDLRDSVVPALENHYSNPSQQVPNHEYMLGGFSSMFMSRNRVRGWNEPSFTIQAGARHAPLHPQAPKMVKIAKDEWAFDSTYLESYRRLSVRECARIQTFPDDHEFVYNRVSDGYKMIGNAVPVEFARRLAEKIRTDLAASVSDQISKSKSRGHIKKFSELSDSEYMR